jgi:hypothetical protein
MILANDIVPIPEDERVPGGPTHRRREYPKAGPQPSGSHKETPKAPSTPQKAGSVPNATELEALTVLHLDDWLVWEFEGRVFDVLGGTHHYTPDWWHESHSMAIEVKGEYIHSRDARILFDAARKENPSVTFIWARKRTTGNKGKRWEVEFYGART